jgi:hypothetical protein
VGIREEVYGGLRSLSAKTLHRFKNLSYDAQSQVNLGIKGDSNPDKDSGGDSRVLSQSAFYLL